MADDSRAMRRAHQLAYEWFVGPIEGLNVLHSCDTPPCVRPSHLFLGTQVINIRDAWRKARLCFGERQWAAKLSCEEVRRIHLLAAGGLRSPKIAAMFGVSARHIRKILVGERWAVS